MPDTLPPLTPPQDTFTGGTAVQTATDPEGHKWQYDNEGGNWVNLDTGEAVSPKVFSQMAGRSGNAARDTMALAEAMRREEATLTPPPRTAPMAPRAQATIAPPTMPIGTNPVIAPERQYTPDQVAQVMAQKPVPSTRVPPSAAANQAYNLQAYQRAITLGMPPKQAAAIYLPGMLASKPMTAGGRIWNVAGGTATPLTPPPAIKPIVPKIHFGVNGEVLQEKGGVVDVLRPADPKAKKLTGVHTVIKADSHGPEISGPSDHPAIVARQKLVDADQAAIEVKRKAQKDEESRSLPNRLKRLVGAGVPVVPLAPPAGRPIGVSTPEGKPTTPEAKLARAKVLRAQHPDWSRQEILDAVNQEAR